MPRLPDYTSLGDGPAPRSNRPSVQDRSGEILGQAIGQAGQALQQVAAQREDQQAQLELTQARSALLVADIQTRQSFANDPDWKTYTQRYQDQMRQASDEALKGISGRRQKQLFQAAAAADIARGSAAVTDQAQAKRTDIGHASTVTTLDALRSSSLQAPDEGTRAAAVGAAHQLIDASVTNGDLTAEQGATIKKQWTADYSKGAVEMLPYDKQIEILSHPKGTVADFLQPDKREEMLQHSILAKQVEDQRALALQKQQQEEQQKAIQNDFLGRMNSGSLTPQDVLHSGLAPFGSGSKDEFLNMLKTQTKEPKTDPSLFNELFARAHLPDGNPGKITNENQLNPYLIAGRISMEDLTKLRNEVQGQNTTEGQSEAAMKKGMFDVARNTLTRSSPLLGIVDPEGEANLQRFTTWFVGEYDKQRAAGKSASQLLSPDSTDYLGKRLQNYMRSPQEIIQGQLGSATAAPARVAPARKEGESMDDYLTRAGK